MGLTSGKLRIAVDLGTTYIKVIGIEKKKKSFFLRFYEIIDLVDHYSIKSVEDINDEVYIDQLKSLVEKYHLKNCTVSATLPSNLATIQTLKLNPDQGQEEIVEKIQSELSQVTIQPLEELHIACFQLDEQFQMDDRIKLLSCALPKEIVTKYQHILQASGLKPEILDLDAFGLYNAFYFFVRKPLTVPVTLVQIGSQYAICLIMLPSKNPFFYIIHQGGNDITTGIMEDLCLPFSKADLYKRRMYQPKWMNKSAYQKSNLCEIYSNFSNKLIDEVKKCMRHFQSIEGVTEMNNIFLTGGGANLAFLVDSFNEQLACKTKIWNPLDYFHSQSNGVNGSTSNPSGLHLTPEIGTLLRGN